MKKISAAAVIALFVTPIVSSAPARAKDVVIRGGGWGHGIGMSQYGAYGRAKKGQGAEKILEHYYRRTNVTGRNMPGVRVGLLQYQTSIGAGARGGKISFKVAGSRDSLASGGPSVSWRVEASSTGRMRLYRDGSRVRRSGRGVFGNPNHPLVLEYERHGSLAYIPDKGIAYKYGRLLFDTYASSSCSGGYCLRLVAVMSMQKYLYGLGEVPSSWPQAALRAQAIAGRTYAYDKIRKYGQHRVPCDCAVVDSVYDQAYIGDAKRTGSGEYWDDWKRAVNKTNEKVILYNGAPIQALYSSSSGGHTENNENVWGGSPLPYLRGVPDGPDAVSANPNHQWSFRMEWSTLSSRLNSYYGIGTLKRIELLRPFGVSGRVTVPKDGGGGARLVGSAKTVRTSGWSLRSALGLKDTLFRIGDLYRIGSNFVRKHRRLNGAPGSPTTNPYDVPKRSRQDLGRAQGFERGRMTWRRATDRAVWQWGKVLRKYNAMGREKSVLRMPTSDVWGPGRYFGGTYANGFIVWSKKGGSHAIAGEFGDAFDRTGRVRGKMGVPLGDRERRDTLPSRGKRQRFDLGTLYRNPHSDKVFALRGKVDRRYRRIGEASSKCGYPTSDTKKTANGSKATFQRGEIVYSKDSGITVSCG